MRRNIKGMYIKRMYEPGKSQNERSATSGPLIWRETQLVEKLSSGSAGSSSSPSRKCLVGLFGFKIALCARRIRSSTSFLFVIMGPNVSLRTWPNTWPVSSVSLRRDTTHFHFPSERDKRHSVGQLLDVVIVSGNSLFKYSPSAGTCRTRQSDTGNWLNQRRLPRALGTNDGNLGQVDINLHPALRCQTNENVITEVPYPVECNLFTRSSMCLRPCEIWGLERPTPLIGAFPLADCSGGTVILE